MMQAFSEQARIWSRIMFLQQLPLIEAHDTYRPCPYLSSLTRDCISRGRELLRRRRPVREPHGRTPASSAWLLWPIRWRPSGSWSSMTRVITMAQLKHALETNFEDTSTSPTGPAIREMCLHAPKYGNDDPYVDHLAKDCLNIVVKELRKHQTRPGQGYGATIAPVAAHVTYGASAAPRRTAGRRVRRSATPAPRPRARTSTGRRRPSSRWPTWSTSTWSRGRSST